MKRIGLLVTLLLISGLLSIGLISRTSSASDAVTIPSRSFQFTYLVHVPALPPGTHQLRVWVPLPYEDRSQGISNLQVLAPISHKVERDKEYNDRYAYFVVDTADTRTPLDIRMTFHAQRFEHWVSLVSTSDAPTEPTVATARFLQPDHLVPIDGVISDLSHAQTNGVMQPLEKARRIYEYVVSTMKYDKNGTGWGRGDALWACDSKRGNCTDFHSVFIGMARATGIPARFEIGFPLPDNSHEGVIPSYHCWAQFFVQGIGWIPVDASEAWKHPEKHDYFFGATDQNRVMFSMGRDIRLKPAQKGDALNYFVYPYAELDGKPFTDLKNEFSFRDDTIPSGPARGIATSD